jgi:SAM-dependent methyltransferase
LNRLSRRRSSLVRDAAIWDELARRNAVWAVCTQPQYKQTPDLDAFFATGRTDVNAVLDAVDRCVPKRSTKRALDFGCGLGRLSRALAREYEQVLGLDVSSVMVREARRLNADVPECLFQLNPQTVLVDVADASCDLVLSLIALQHISDQCAVRAYLREFGRVCSVGGAVAVQLPTAVEARIHWRPARLIAAVLRALRVPAWMSVRLLPGASMALAGQSEQEVRAQLEAGGLEVREAITDLRTGSDAAPSRLYIAVKPASTRPNIPCPDRSARPL